MVKAVDSDPVIAGFEEITLIWYPAPDGVPAGMVKLIVPLRFVPTDEVLSRDPIVTGLEKVPAAFDNWAVKTLPGL
jgi:hypothetical protein